MSKQGTPLWREAQLEAKMYKTHQVRTTFGSSNVEKVHAVVARSTFRSQNVQSTTCSRHFWTLKRRFVWQAQGILRPSKSEQNVRVLWQFQLQPPLHYTPLQLNYATLRYITLHYTNYTTPHYTPLHPATLHYTQLHYATLHYITLYYTNYNCNYNYITPQYTTLH